MRKNMKTFLLLAFLLVPFSCLIIYKIVQNYVLEFTIARYKLVDTFHHEVDGEKIILFWNNFFNYNYWQMPNETNYEGYLKALNCPVTNCVLTHKKDFLNSSHLYDAIVFHGAESWGLHGPPKIRSPHQFYVLAALE